MSEHDNSGTREERTNSLRDRIVPFTPETRELLRGWRVVFRPRGETRVSAPASVSWSGDSRSTC